MGLPKTTRFGWEVELPGGQRTPERFDGTTVALEHSGLVTITQTEDGERDEVVLTSEEARALRRVLEAFADVDRQRTAMEREVAELTRKP